jgi:hypothetical protein
VNEVDELPEIDTEETEDEELGTLADDEELQKRIISKIIEHNSKGKANRMAEVQLARDQRLYFRDIQQIWWDEDAENITFESPDNDSPNDRVFNIYQPYGKIFISTFMGARPKVRAEADDPFDSTSVRNTAKAQTYERVYRKFNDTPTQQMETARLMWTDSRIITRTVKRDDGKIITEFWGTLESRVQITAKYDIEVPLKNNALIELEDEFPTVQMKREYDKARKKINSGNGDSYERNARIAVKRQAGTDTSIDVQTGEDAHGLSTKTWSYMRPEFFENFDKGDRELLEEMHPDGLCLVRNGDVYLDSYDCQIDGELDVILPLPGDGMSRPSVGKTTMSLQDSANTAQNLIEEMFDHGIPTTYWDTTTDIDGLNKSREMPGQSRKFTRKAGEAASNHFFQTQPINPPQQLMNYAENLKGPQAQFASGQQPAIFGAEMEDQKTASGYAQARNMALGQMAIVWKPYTAWYAREMTRAVKMSANHDKNIVTTLPALRKGGRPQAVSLSPTDLQGLSFTNESDENFPETWTEKSNKMMSLLQIGGPIADWVLETEPDNLYSLKQYIGLDELVIPGEDMRNNVLADIAAMEHMVPEPDVTQMPQQAFPGVGQPPVQIPEVSPIPLDTDFLEDDDYEVGWKTVKHWVQSPAGQDAKRDNPDWFKNVRLYGLQYKQKVDEINAAKQQAMQPPPPPPKGPGEAIGYKDLPPSGKIQMAAQAGITLTPEDVAAQEAQEAAANAPPIGAM